MHIVFTRHAEEKMVILAHYGFTITKQAIISAVTKPDSRRRRGHQFTALKNIDYAHALAVVYENRNGYQKIITIYPVRRSRYEV